MNYGFQFQVHEKSIKNWKSLVESDEDSIAMVYWQERKGGKKHIITPVMATENGSVDQSGICNKSIHLFLEGRASWWNSYSWWWAMVYGRVTCSIKDDTKFLLPSIPPSLTVSLPFFLPSMLSVSFGATARMELPSLKLEKMKLEVIPEVWKGSIRYSGRSKKINSLEMCSPVSWLEELVGKCWHCKCKDLSLTQEAT